MNVAFVNATHRWGGVKSWSLRLARGLRSRGHDVHLFVRPDNPFAKAARDADLTVFELTFGPDYNPLAIWKLRRQFQRHRIDVVVTNVSKDNRIAGPAARSLNIPVLQRVGGPGDILDRRHVRREQEQFVTHIVVPATSIKAQLETMAWMRAPERVTVIPNGVDLNRFAPGQGRGRLRLELGLTDTTPVLVTTGQLTRIKGHAHLLRALATIPLRSPQPVVAFVGTGKEETALRELARELNLEKRVFFLGFRQDIGDWVEDADIAVQPSLAEGFPNSVVEFMAKGKPVVATALSGVPEAIDHGLHGLLVPPGDEGALGAAIQELMLDPEKRRRMGEAARERAVEKFDELLMVDRVEALLESLIPPRGSSRP